MRHPVMPVTAGLSGRIVGSNTTPWLVPPAVARRDPSRSLRGRQTRFVAELHIPELDGIRAVAVWMVILGHLQGGWSMPAYVKDSIPWLLRLALGHGWLGVDLFFVLSGFLITGILLDSREKPDYFKNFYMRRFLRIMPLYFTVIAICWLLYPQDHRYLLLSAGFLANVYYVFGLEQPHGSGVLWSLAVEEHFYLVWPCLVKVCSRRTITLIALAIVAGIPFVRVWALHAGFDRVNEIYVYTWTRCDGLALGALMAIWVRSRWADRRNSLRLAAGLCCASLVLTLVGIPYGILESGSEFRSTQAQLLFAGLVVSTVAMRGTPYTAPLRWRLAKLSGDLSYCLYLVHLTVGDLYQEAVKKLGIDAGPYGAVILRSIVIVTVSFGMALLSRKFLEQPALRLKRYFENATKRHFEYAKKSPSAEVAAVHTLLYRWSAVYRTHGL